MLIMIIATALFNGFFTNQLSIDSIPRITVVGIYSTAFCVHFWYVWSIGAQFYGDVAAGSTWSLLERARFAVTSVTTVRSRAPKALLAMRGISKTNSGHKIPIFNVRFNHEVDTSASESRSSEELSDRGWGDRQRQPPEMSQPQKKRPR
jgi:hypothetical protein